MNRILIGIVLLVLGCQNSDFIKDTGEVRLSGKIYTVSSYGREVKLNDALDRTMVIAPLEDGTFDLSIPLSTAGYYNLKIGSETIELYLSKGYNLSFEIDETSGKFNLSGRGSECNLYIHKYQEFEEANKPPYNNLLAKSEEEFLLEARRYRSKSEAFLNNFQNKNVNLDPKFIAKERARILYAWANRLAHYPEAHIFYTGEDEFVVSADYHDYKKTVNLDAEDLLTLEEYQTFVTAYVDTEADILKKKGDKRDLDQIRFDVATQDITMQGVRDFAMYALLKRAMRDGLSDVTADLLEIFYDECQNSILLAEIRTSEKRWNSIQPGKKAPTFALTTSSDEVLHLNDFRGRFVYIMIWASWCTPCTDQNEALEEVAQEIDSNLIALLALSIDSNPEDWRQSLPNRRDRSSVLDALVHPDDLQHIQEDYSIRGLPRCILIDSAGKIIDSNAPLPSDPELVSVLASKVLAAE